MTESMENKKPQKRMSKKVARMIFKAVLNGNHKEASYQTYEIISSCAILNEKLGHPEKKLGFFLHKRKK